MKDRYLKFKFTDRGGADVYDVHHVEDRLSLANPLFEIRIKVKVIAKVEEEATE